MTLSVSGNFTRLVVACSATMLFAFPILAQTKAERDSIVAHATAVNTLRLFEYRYNTLVRIPGARNLPPRIPTYGVCEFSIGDYCYGPKNGGLVPGGIGTTSEARSTSPANFARQFQKRSNAYINLYLSDLNRLRRTIPGDRWINGEIVRTEIDRSNYIRAMESLDKCKAEEWWCAALRAHVIHASGMWRRADSAWTKVLAMMPEEERCAWLDPTWLVKDEVFNQQYRMRSCRERIRIAERFWWLSDPLFSIEGNERRSEHLSRVAELILIQWHREHRMMTPAMAMREKAPPVNRPMPVGATASSTDLDDAMVEGSVNSGQLTFRFGYPEVVMRLGAPEWTAREEGTISTIVMYPTNRLSFVPQGAALFNPVYSDAQDWNLHADDAFEFMSTWPTRMREVEFQVAHFRRGDSSSVVAAVDVSGDSVLQYEYFMASVTRQRDFDQPATKTEKLGFNVFRFEFVAPRDSSLFAVELLATSGLTGRARFGSGPPVMPRQRVTLSDVLLTEPLEPMPAGLTEAGWRALGTTRVNVGSRIGVFWEVYGLQKDEKPSITLLVVPAPPGFFGRIARALSLRRPSDSLSIRLEATPVAGNEVEHRALNIDLSSLSIGEYSLEVVVDVEGQQRVVTRRMLEIREPPRLRLP